MHSSCELLPVKCEESTCKNHGKCTEGWNRYICDCSATSFTGPTCEKGKQSLSIDINYEDTNLLGSRNEKYYLQNIFLISDIRLQILKSNFRI